MLLPVRLYIGGGQTNELGYDCVEEIDRRIAPEGLVHVSLRV